LQAHAGLPKVDEPLFDPEELGGIIPVDTKKSFDIRKVGCLAS
jgi:acetyl-CoA carboxylase carboxyltransferase component